MNVRWLHSVHLVLWMSSCLVLTGCDGDEADPTEALRAFVANAFDKAMADTRMRAEFDLEPPHFVVQQRGDGPPEVEVTIPGVDRAIKGLDVADWVLEKRDRVKGGGRGRINLARKSGDEGERTFVFVYALQDGRWSLHDARCAGRGFVPHELKRYFELAAPASTANR